MLVSARSASVTPENLGGRKEGVMELGGPNLGPDRTGLQAEGWAVVGNGQRART